MTFLFAAVNAFLYAKNAPLVIYYWLRLGHLPNIAAPNRYGERMLWRKLIDHNPQFVVFSDKLASKDFIKSRCPDLALPRTLWVGRDAEMIPEELLRGDVYVKANHGSNFNYRVCGGHYDRADLRKKTSHWLASRFGHRHGEWSYSKVEPKLFVEEAIGDAEAGLLDFRVRACNGQAILGSVTWHCRTSAEGMVFLDPEGSPTFGPDDVEGSPLVPSPEALGAMEPYRRAVQYARQLSIGLDYARFDFMWNGRDLFGGEITVYPASGMTKYTNSVARAAVLDGWDLRQSHFLRSPHTGLARIYAEALERRLEERYLATSRTSLVSSEPT